MCVGQAGVQAVCMVGKENRQQAGMVAGEGRVMWEKAVARHREVYGGLAGKRRREGAARDTAGARMSVWQYIRRGMLAVNAAAQAAAQTTSIQTAFGSRPSTRTTNQRPYGSDR